MDNTVDITGEAFARRLGNLLAHQRERSGRDGSGISLGAMARRSNGHFTRRELRQFEAAGGRLDAVTVSALATLYGADIESILPERTDITIDPGDGTISAGGVRATFDTDDPRSLLETYLRLVRRLRNQERDEVVDLRREDVEGLAAHLDEPGESVVEQLGALMGATRTQRRAMAGMFIAGALIITVAVPSVAAVTGGEAPSAFDVTPGSPTANVVDMPDPADPDPADPDPANTADDPAPRERPAEIGVVLEDPDLVQDVVPGVTGASETTLASESSDPVVDTPPVATPPTPPVAPAPVEPPAAPAPAEVDVGPPPVPSTPTVVVDPSPAAAIGTGAPVAEPEEPEVAVGPPPVPAPPDEIVEPGPGPVLPVPEPVSP